ncbi:hypothetical protein [Streptomyces sp. NPDC058045]|uniref:hypothetical protein n=1 Tax=Streptomyces sp. NPDC058045 TaxID=3346311 RepID=UPI0036E8650A
MRVRTTAIAATTCALVLLPAAGAMAGTGPAPAPHNSVRAQSTAPSEAGNPLSAKAQAADVCTDAYQIGSTGYIDRGGVHIASVKQFYSPKCKENYGYLWIWQDFRNKVKSYDVSTGVYSYPRDAVLGKVTVNQTHGQEFWSKPAATIKECTSGIGTLRAAGDPLTRTGTSSKRC